LKLFSAPFAIPVCSGSRGQKFAQKRRQRVGVEVGRIRLATFKPSGNATMAPTTPGNSIARATISFGVA